MCFASGMMFLIDIHSFKTPADMHMHFRRKLGVMVICKMFAHLYIPFKDFLSYWRHLNIRKRKNKNSFFRYENDTSFFLNCLICPPPIIYGSYFINIFNLKYLYVNILCSGEYGCFLDPQMWCHVSICISFPFIDKSSGVYL